MKKIGIIGCGAMGRGIAQVAAMAGHQVQLFDTNTASITEANSQLKNIFDRLEEKGKIEHAKVLLDRIQIASELFSLADCGLVIEAVVENLEVKKNIFKELEPAMTDDCILATNTSSLSVTSIAAACQKPERVIGLHFFNPPPLMALVEVIPALQTNPEIVSTCMQLMSDWGKVPVLAKDTPGFIVNRVARPFYSEAIRIYEEGIADMPTIDWAMKELGGFRMGPFELMDYIGHDVNYVVTESVFSSFFFDPRYKPSFAQKRLLEAGWLGRKSGRGFYNYADGVEQPTPTKDEVLGQKIKERIVAMLINEAVDARYLNIASEEDLDLAMTKGVNYPKGLLAWCKEWGAEKVLQVLDHLYDQYHEDRYRASVLLRQMAQP